MHKKNVIIGIFVGLIANSIGLFLAANFLDMKSGKHTGVIKVIEAAQIEGFFGKLVSLGAILNLIAFFIFIKKRQDYKARGVLIATMLIAVLTFVIKL
ncbi:MAG: hypothetical protein HRT67_12405 [Flavobacteriaceae bacterium]|nr:hypothetical protein [Flavobacteriaceae bacterium]